MGVLKDPNLKKFCRPPYAPLGVKRLSALLLTSTLLGLGVPGCVYDPDDRCGELQHEIDNDRCVCDAGYVPSDTGCVPCGDHEVEKNGACECVPGFARPAEGATCEEIPAELGIACDDSTPCLEGGKYPLCHVTEDAAGYCTSTCTDDGDCGGGYRCQADGEAGFCRRPPVGFGDDCDSDADCTGEATFCETIQSHVCLVRCSAGKTAGCFVGDVCCDYSLFEPVCVPATACTKNGGLEVP
jgi:hypothetical protein